MLGVFKNQSSSVTKVECMKVREVGVEFREMEAQS